jgi:hypothetical protein
MGLFDFLKRGKGEPDADEEEPTADDEPPPVAVALVREGFNVPTDDEMLAVLAAEAPECAELPRTGLSQMRWWREEDWVTSGLRGVARALRHAQDTDPDLATWRIVKDDRGARVAIVFLRR